MPLIEVPDAEFWYDDTGGDGPPVVLVHPAAASSLCWEQQVPAFVVAGYRCITYDLRGWHRSRQRLDARNVGHISSDLEALTQQLRIGRFALVGAAYGGMGALDYALRFQQRLPAFVLATNPVARSSSPRTRSAIGCGCAPPSRASSRRWPPGRASPTGLARSTARCSGASTWPSADDTSAA